MTTAPETASGPAGLLAELEWRGILQETTPGLPGRLATGRPIAGYIGFDPTADSLHVGHLVPIFGLLRLQRFGGRPVALVGGGTGMIGDPSGRSTERNLLDRETLEANVAAIRGQLERFLDFAPGSNGAILVNNLDWLGQLSLIDFLRDTGKHFTIPYMLDKESVQVRLSRGLSFTEFSYMLLQAYDFAHMHRTMGVELQMGGADQWGNITAGLELIRRTSGAGDGVEPAHGLAYKLLLSPSGSKFGKSEGGESVWLDAARTSPFDFYQYWRNVDDRDVGTYLRWFTEFPRDRIEALDAETEAHPEARAAQLALAFDITARTHGAEAARARCRGFGRHVRVRPGRRSGRPRVDVRVVRRVRIRPCLAGVRDGGPPRRGGGLRLARRGAPDDRGRWRDRQWPAGHGPRGAPRTDRGGVARCPHRQASPRDRPR